MPEFIVDDVRVSYHVHGSGPVCLAHPGGPGVHWPYLRMPELEQQLTMVYLEPVGTGASDLRPDGDYSMENYAAYVAALIRHLGEERVFLLGHSHGGFVALQTSLDHADLLRGVIVYDSMAFNGPELGEQAFKNIEAYVAARPAGDPLAAQVLAAWKSEPSGREEELEMLQRLLPVYFKDFEAVAPRLQEWMKTVDITVDPNRQPALWDIRPRLGEIGVPTLVIVGTADFICPENSARELADGIPGASLVVLPESGHFGHVEEPEAFRDAVLRFVAEH
ncbi:alpha/beta hydrolase [Kribbella sp. NPDC026611]|uniref:alpha/beta fold hydrolase n=1 Tax=Kribbella sp. NPDC026611 TaxID=3154911 RepID=UPI0033CFDC80